MRWDTISVFAAGAVVLCLVGLSGMKGVHAGGGATTHPSLPWAAGNADDAKTKTARKTETAATEVAATPPAPRIKNVPAKKLFGYERRPADLAPRSIGSYAKGCLAGGKMLPPTGRYWQAMRLSRNRNWAHPALVDLVMQLAEDAHNKDGWRGLLVGDLTQPRGGPMLSGHKSHQIGLDADIWLREMPDRVIPRAERETFQPISMLKNSLDVDPAKMTKKHHALIRRAAMYPQVARIGVNPAIKVALCREAGGDTPWLAKIQSWPGHHYHMHIRLKCPAGSSGCTGQGRPRRTSCRVAEKWYRDTKAWLERPKKKKKKAAKKRKKKKAKPPIRLSGLPAACRRVLTAQARDSIEDLIVPPIPKPPPAPILARQR